MPAQPGTDRQTALDGLRGWAALSVVIYHCLWENFGPVFPELRTPLAAVIGNGSMAVGVFLLISGYVLTRRRWRRNDNPPLTYAFVRRYVRLTLPALVSVLVVWLLMSLSLTPTAAAYEVNSVPIWYDRFARFVPDIASALNYGTLSMYWMRPVQNYNPFLWTIAVELWGSLIIFAISQSGRVLREPYSAVLLFIALAMVRYPLIACFPIGALVALLERDGVIFSAPPGKGESLVATLVLVAGLAGGTFAMVANLDPWFFAIPAVAIFVASRRSLPALWFLETPVSQLLGKLSYPIYVLQFAVIVSPAAFAMVWLHDAGRLNPLTALLTAFASVALALGLALLFLPVELGTLALIRRMDGLVKRWRPAPAALAS